ncbi:MAG: hypothetical protein JNK15_02270 [Planctomycetes bacterium]|nr:hypothetical protein [Planctomycetota bacterium]
MKNPLPIAGAVVALVAVAAAQEGVQAEVEALKKRVAELEDAQAEREESVSGRALVQAFSARSLDFGGHLTSLFTWIDGESDSEAGHMVSLVELYLKARIDDNWSAFATPGFYTFNGGLLDNPATPFTAGDPAFVADDISQSKTFLSRLVTEWRHGDALVLRGGVIGSPHGVTNREYFLPSRIVGQANLHSRYFLTNTLYPQVVEGLSASGKHVLGQDWVEYDVYFGAEDNSAADGIGGARIGYTFAEIGLTLAANYGRGTREATATPATNFGILQAPFAPNFNLGRDYQFGGIDADYRKGDLLVRAEGYYSAEDGFEDQRAASLEGSVFVAPQWSATYRFDYYDRGEDLNLFTTTVLPLGASTEHVFGVSFNPNDSVRLRLDWHHNNLPGSDDVVDYVNFSWSISF